MMGGELVQPPRFIYYGLKRLELMLIRVYQPKGHLCISELMGQPEKNVWEKPANVLFQEISMTLPQKVLWFDPPIPLEIPVLVHTG